MSEYVLDENSSVEVTVTGLDGQITHESWDTIDMIESGYTFNQMVAEYKKNGARMIQIEVMF